ncbi:hypothetical protein ACOSQ3_032490 [Xanthoceras sorbifolium]
MIAATMVKSHEVTRAKSSVLIVSGATRGLHNQGFLKMRVTMWCDLDDRVTWSRESVVSVAPVSACRELDGCALCSHASADLVDPESTRAGGSRTLIMRKC